MCRSATNFIKGGLSVSNSIFHFKKKKRLMHFFYVWCKILFLILTDRGVMRHFRFIIMSSFLAVFLLFFACGSDDTTSTPNPRTITVTINNLDTISAVHVYFDLEEPGEENLVPPKDSIIAQILARRMGHSVTVHVAEGDKPGSPAFYSRSVRVTQTSWDSGEAELRWTGTEIIPLGW
jgi:hypothetical protein